jgi:hypothetical protein
MAATATIGLSSYRWNNNIKSMLLLAGSVPESFYDRGSEMARHAARHFPNDRADGFIVGLMEYGESLAR